MPELLPAQDLAGVESLPVEAKGFSGEGLRLFPLGWSSEGRWAALIYQSSVKSGESFFIQVIDAVSDEILYRSDNFGAAEFSAEKAPMLTEVQAAFNLEGRERPDVRDVDFVTGGFSYTFFLDPPSPARGAYRLRIRSSRGDVKEIYKSSISRVPDRAVLLGAILSPFGDRSLAVVREISVDGTASYRFSGAHLIQGFSSQPVPNQDLVSAVMNGQEYLLRSRLNAGSNPNAVDSRGYSIVLIAARLGNWGMLEQLLNAGARPDSQDSDGRTALHHAAFAGQLSSVRHLLAAGADKKIIDNAGRIAADLSADATIRALLR